MPNFLLAIDQGTTSTRAMIFDAQAQCVAYHQIPLSQSFPALGWVEHDPEEIWQAVLVCCKTALEKAQLSADDIAGIGITNQRETTIVWDRKTGTPIHPAIVWQDRRGAPICESLSQAGYESTVRAKTGLLLDPYFSASKIHWLLDHVPDARKRAHAGELAFGTVDSFLLWKLTQGEQHATDATNASRTLLFNIHTQTWDSELLALFDIPEKLLPAVRDNTAHFGETYPALFGRKIPICAMAGDQQAALVGQACFQPGMLKSTYGTGIFVMLNTGEVAANSQHRLLTTLAYRINGKVTYALEGSAFSSGSAIQWLRDGLGIIQHADETESVAANLESNGGVYFVPAFTGLGAPYWAPHVRASIQGITRDTKASHLVRAALEAVAYQTRDLLDAMLSDAKVELSTLHVDGGMVKNAWLMQFLSDVLGLPVAPCVLNETTALGVAYLTGLQLGLFSSCAEIATLWRSTKCFEPQMLEATREALYQHWQRVVRNCI